jgi:membrane protease YdiL (CAAX protease family)
MGETPTGPQISPPELVIARPITWPARRPTAPLELPTLSTGGAVLGLALVGLLLVTTFVIAVVIAVGQSLLGGDPLDRLGQSGLLMIDKWTNALLALAVAGLFARAWRLPVAAFGLRWDRFDEQLIWGFGTLGGAYAGLVLSSIGVMLYVALHPELQHDLSDRLEVLSELSQTDFLGTALLLVAVAIHEEILFRGLLIPLLRRLGCGWAVAVAASTAVFAVLHLSQGALAVPQVFCVGLALGAFFVWSRSLLAVMVAHFAFDLLQLQLAKLLLPWLADAADVPLQLGIG